MVTGIHESKNISKNISWKCKSKFKGRKYNLNQKWNNDRCRCEYKNPRRHHMCENDYIGNSGTCACDKIKYLESIIDDLAIKRNKITEAARSEPVYLNDKKVTREFDKFNILLAFLLSTILLLIIVRI